MPPIPKPQASTVTAIYAAYEAANEHWDSLGISVGEIGTECDRALWFNLHWASQPEEIDGRTLSIFRTGDAWENRMVADLESIGVEVFDQQRRIRLVSGHVRGKIDGKGIGIPEAPNTVHLLEFKSSNTENFKLIRDKNNVRESKPLHFGQLQIGMHHEGLTRAGYLVTDKDTDERHFERVEYDALYCARQLARAERIVNTSEPPSRISENPDFFGCRFCKHKAVCHDGAWSRVNCRTCLFSTPTLDGDAAWDCARWTKPLSIDEQKQGCGAHLYIPSLVPGEQIDADENAETVTYRLRDGRIWVDGAANDNEDHKQKSA